MVPVSKLTADGTMFALSSRAQLAALNKATDVKESVIEVFRGDIPTAFQKSSK